MMSWILSFHLRLNELVKSDPQIAQLVLRETVRKAARQPQMTYDQMIAVILDGYADRPALGERDYNIVESEIGAWSRHPDYRVNPGDFICVLGFTSADFVIVGLACAYARAVSAPLQTALAGADLGRRALTQGHNNLKPVRTYKVRIYFYAFLKKISIDRENTFE